MAPDKHRRVQRRRRTPCHHWHEPPFPWRAPQKYRKSLTLAPSRLPPLKVGESALLLPPDKVSGQSYPAQKLHDALPVHQHGHLYRLEWRQCVVHRVHCRAMVSRSSLSMPKRCRLGPLPQDRYLRLRTLHSCGRHHPCFFHRVLASVQQTLYPWHLQRAPHHMHCWVQCARASVGGREIRCAVLARAARRNCGPTMTSPPYCSG